MKTLFLQQDLRVAAENVMALSKDASRYQQVYQEASVRHYPTKLKHQTMQVNVREETSWNK